MGTRGEEEKRGGERIGRRRGRSIGRRGMTGAEEGEERNKGIKRRMGKCYELMLIILERKGNLKVKEKKNENN